MAHILLVEDEIDLRDNLEVVLTHAGHDVATAGNGREALEIIEISPPDLVVSDISMPVMSGLQMLTLVRRNMPALAEMPIVFLTALGDREHVVEGRRVGADDYLTKPVDYQVLTAVVDARLARVKAAGKLKEKQFVKLFKGLTKKREEAEAALYGGDAPPLGASPSDAAPSDAAPSPLDRIAAAAEPSLRGRVQLLYPDEFIGNFINLPPSARSKALTVIDRIIGDWAHADDVAVDLGAGARLLVASTVDRHAAADRFAFLRMRLGQALSGRTGRAASDPGAGDPGAGDPAEDGFGEAFGVDAELKEALRAFHRASLKSGAAAAEEQTAVFADLAASFRVDYQPVWDARSKSSRAFHAQWRRVSGRSTLWGADALLLGDDDPLVSDVAAFAMDAATCDAMSWRGRSEPGGESPVVVVTVPLTAFEGMSAYKIERRIEDMAGLLERGGVGFYLPGLNEDTSLGALRKALGASSRAGDLLILDMNMNFSKLQRLPGLGCRMLRVDLSARNAAMSGERARGVVFSCIRQATEAGFDVWAAGVDDNQVGRRAIQAGATWLSGKAAGEPRPFPDCVSPSGRGGSL